MYDTMLIVDDVAIEREVLMALFQDSFTILEATNGQEALETIESCKGNIDVVVMDLMMPGMDGFEVLERRQHMEYFKEIPVVVLTRSEDARDQIRAFEYGANDFITKPIIPEIAVSRINNVLASSRRIEMILRESKELKVKSEMDLMTGLYNKATAERLIEQTLVEQKENLHAMMVIDIDNFKSVNENEGHLVGDHTIKIIADLISTHFRNSDIIGRIGGDEFVVFMVNIPNKEIARQKARDIVRLMKYKPNLTIPVNASVSMGLAFNKGELTDYHNLFHLADEALYQSKRRGKARLTEYGIEEKINFDNRDAIILCSRDKRVCRSVGSVVNDSVQFKEMVAAEELALAAPEFKGRMQLVFVDVSDEPDAGKSVWEKLAPIEALKGVPMIAICKEGHMEEYKQAVLSNLPLEILSVPIEMQQLQRRVDFYLQQMGR